MLPRSEAFSTNVKHFFFHSWDDFYQGEDKRRVYQSEFKDFQYESDGSYFLKNLIIQDLTTNAILISSMSNIKFLSEGSSFSNITTTVATRYGTSSWEDSQAGAFFFENYQSECVINRCLADNCYNKISTSYYYLDGGNFASFRYSNNKILLTSISSCAPDHYGVSAFRSRDTSGNYTGLNISACNTYDTPLFTKFPSDDDFIKYSIFNENSASNSESNGIAVVFSGKLTINSCCFSNNSLFTLIYSSHSVNVILTNSIIIDNSLTYIAYANYGYSDMREYSKIFIQNCFFEGENTDVSSADGALVSKDNINNSSLKILIMNDINNIFCSAPITNAQNKYHLKSLKVKLFILAQNKN